MVESISTLRKVAKIFDVIKKISNLGLKIKKCVLVPLGGPLTEDLLAKVKNFLNDHVPQWANVRIQDSGEYLGFWVGPKIKEKVWSKAEAKWDSRARSIAAAKLAPSLGVEQYNSRAVSTMGYVAQLFPLHANTLKCEKARIQNVFHILNNTFPLPILFRMKSVKCPQPSSLQALSFAARHRTAVKTLTTWQRNLNELDRCRSDHAPLGWLVGQSHSTPWWDTPPIVDLVAEAASGFQNKFGDLGADIRVQRKSSNRIGLQSAAIKVILPKLYPICFETELARRLRLWIPADKVPCDLERRIEDTIKTAASMKFKPFFVTAMLHTWCNGWTTSQRTSSPKRACIYGCTERDSLVHYMTCPVFWKLLREMEKHSDNLENDDLIGHLALVGDAKSNIFCIGVALDAYNNLKSMRSLQAAAIKEQVSASYKRLSAL